MSGASSEWGFTKIYVLPVFGSQTFCHEQSWWLPRLIIIFEPPVWYGVCIGVGISDGIGIECGIRIVIGINSIGIGSATW